jgi:hypothetical protein
VARERERKVWLFNRPEPTPAAGVSKIELNLGEPALEIAPAEVAELFALVVRGVASEVPMQRHIAPRASEAG